MITIDLLKNHPNSIPALTQIWYEVLGKVWNPDASIENAAEKLNQHLNQDILPLTFVALDAGQPVGMCSLRENDGIRADLKPWLGSLVVDPSYQERGIGRLLIEATKKKARDFGFQKLYLFAFDPTIPEYYARLGWQSIGMEEFKDHPVTVMELCV